jgi:nitronate monooxygenase
MWPRDGLTSLLGIEHPILQAPMGGESTVEMAVAVSRAGGLGGLGCSFMANDEIVRSVARIRSMTDRPFNLNFFAHPEPVVDAVLDARAEALVRPFYEELGLEQVPRRPEAPCDTFGAARLELVLELRPKVLSFHFGIPPADVVHVLRDCGVIVLCTVTTVAEAKSLEGSGVSAVIAQGWEAGGHRGTFHPSFEDVGVGGLALVPQIVDAVDVPVVAAGGIADGRGIAAAFALGASGVQMGSAFLSCPEANISADYRAALGEAMDEDTRLTRAFSGRPARARANRFTEAMARHRSPVPDFPRMYGLSGPLEAAAREKGRRGFEFYLWGQAAALNRDVPAGALVELLVREARDSFALMAGAGGP